VWWTDAPPKLSANARRAIGSADRIGIPTISCLEFVVLVQRGRITIDREPREWVRRALAQDGVEPLPLTADIATDAALLEREGFHGDPVDRIIYTTARATNSQLVTRDSRIRRFDRRLTIW
jgi:PIN domain nuclease of toxin-antitoxin system